MRVRVTAIVWDNGTASPGPVVVELDDDTPDADIPAQIEYALFRAKDVRVLSYDYRILLQ